MRVLNKIQNFDAKCKHPQKDIDEIKFNNLFSAKVIEATKPEFILEFNFETVFFIVITLLE